MVEGPADPPAGSLLGPELFIGLVAAVGTDHDQITTVLQEVLASFRYKTKIIRLTTLLRAIPHYKKLPTGPVDVYIAAHQKAGDDFRETIENPNALAALSIGEIQDCRVEENQDKNKIIQRCAYIIRSLKTPEEVDLLREIYGNAFILLASSAPYHVRRRYLAGKIAQSNHSFQHDQFFAKAEELIQKDQEEVGYEYGQNLKNTFPKADLFVDASDYKLLRQSIERGLDLLFGNTFHTPTRDEFGMFHAMGASLRSSELGRQVGAVITTAAGDIIAIGTNEVPKAGGGLYWAGDEPDHREFVKGEDSSDVHKKSLIEDLLKRLRDDGWLAPAKAGTEIEELGKQALDASICKHFSGGQVTHLIEFGRAVHAEMAAITDAARRGVPIAGSTMYLTTFPCHLCARLIVAAGIVRVVYIEPYTKSLALQLYPDSISADHSERTGNQMRLEPFVGIAPRRYQELFTMRKRKDKNGKAIPFERTTALPRLLGSPRSYLAAEKIAFDDLEKIIEKKQIMNEQKELPNV